MGTERITNVYRRTTYAFSWSSRKSNLWTCTVGEMLNV